MSGSRSTFAPCTYADDKQVVTWLYWTPDGTKRKEKLGGQPTHGECLITF